VAKPERPFGRRVAAIVVALQVLALLAYATLHSPAVQPLTKLLHLRKPGFCYFVCP